MLPVGDPFEQYESSYHLSSIEGNVQLLPTARLSGSVYHR